MPTLAKSENERTVSLNVLGYSDEQEGAWVALALEMDLRGYGSTFDEALEELAELVGMQIGFARFKEQPEMIWKPADPVYWTRFAEARRDRLHEFISSSTPRNPQYTVADLPLPPAHVINAMRDFCPIDG